MPALMSVFPMSVLLPQIWMIGLVRGTEKFLENSSCKEFCAAELEVYLLRNDWLHVFTT